MTSNNIESLVRKYSSAIDYEIPRISIILAAGHGKRMKSSKPKVLYEILGVPAVIRVSEAAKKGISSPNQIIVVGVKAEKVVQSVGKKKDIRFVYQKQQNGTGDAVKTALEAIDKKFSGDIYIFPADAGLITEDIIKDFRNYFEKSDCDMMMLTGEYRGETAKNHYGRIIKDKKTDEVIEIKEYKDVAALNDMYKIVHRGKALSFTRDELLDIREYNSAIYACKIEPLKKYLPCIEPTNVQKEYYFTDMIKIFNKHNLKVGSQTIKDSDSVMGFNDRVTLEKMNDIAHEQLRINNPVISLSGIRAIVGEYFGKKEIYKAVNLFLEIYLKKQKKPRKIIIGRDIKPSGETLLEAAAGALYDNKIETTANLGIITLPIIEWAVKHFQAAGGIFITASHNPLEYNGVKFISSSQDGAGILSASIMQKIKDKWEGKKTNEITAAELPEEISCLDEYNKDVIEKIKKVIDKCAGHRGTGEKIFNNLKEKQPKIALDACSEDGLKIPKSFLLSLGIKEENIYPVNAEMLSQCKRRLEPSPEYLVQLKETIQKHYIDIGFALDPDQDRLVIMPLSSEELTPVLCAKFLLELQKNSSDKHIKQIPINLSTSSLWDELAREYSIEIIRTRVGEINVVEAMRKYHLPLGAEGNGGVILKDINAGRNSTVGMALILAYMTYSGQSIQKLESWLPKYFMVKYKATVSVGQEKINEFLGEKMSVFTKQNRATIKSIDKKDGYKITFKDGSWVHIRTSNTEPIIRLIAESKHEEKAKTLIAQFKSLISKPGISATQN